MSSFQTGGGECQLKDGKVLIDYSVLVLLVRFFTTSKIRIGALIFSLGILFLVPAPITPIQRLETLGILVVVGFTIALVIFSFQKIVTSFGETSSKQSRPDSIKLESIESVELENKWPYPAIHIRHRKSGSLSTTTLQFPTRSFYAEEKGAARALFENNGIPVDET